MKMKCKSAIAMVLVLVQLLTSAEADFRAKRLDISKIDPDLIPTLEEYGEVNATKYETAGGWNELLRVVQDFEDDEEYERISQDVIPFSNDSSVNVWYPPLETMIYKGTENTDDVSAVYIRVIHEILSNMTFYGGDKVVENVFDVFGMKPMTTTFLSLLNMGLPTSDQLLVRMWKTDFINDAMDFFGSSMSTHGDLDTMFQDPIVGLMGSLQNFVLDYDNVVFKDLAVVLGKPLGPSIIPFLKSMSQQQSSAQPAQPAENATLALQEKVEEVFPDLIKNLRMLGVKNVLYNKYLPIPCIKGDDYCPVKGTPYVRAFSDMYNLTKSDRMTEEEFGLGFQDAMVQYFRDKSGDIDPGNIISRMVNNKTASIGNIIKQGAEVNNHMYDVLNSLANNTYAMDIDEDVLETGFDPRTAVCMTNITAAMYESPETGAAWIDGLGLEPVGDAFPLLGDLSSRGQVFVDKSQNAVIVGIEGVPVIHKYFQRGFFGWLDLLVGGVHTFEYPCTQMFIHSNKDRCIELSEKYSHAKINSGFAPLDSVIVNALRPQLEKAAAMFDSKPKLYITGHSLGGPLAKNTLAQVLLRGYDEDFSSVTTYALGGPVVGNEAYVDMIDELIDMDDAPLYQIVNSYDPIPYFPAIFETQKVNKGNQTFLFDVNENRFVSEEPMRKFKAMPSNILLSFEGAHAPKTQYLPLARSMLSDYDYGTCEEICSVEQCGKYKCEDTCSGVL